MRRAFAIGFALLAFARPVAGQGITARIGGELTGFTGGSVTVPLVVDMGTSGQRLGSYTARIQWDSTVLKVACTTFCDVLPGNFPAPQVNSDSVSFGVLRFTAVSPAGVGGLVTIAQIRFSILAAQTSALSLSFSEMSAAGTFVALTPVTSGATFCPARGYWGDANADAAVGSFDALLALSAAVGHDVSAYPQIGLADVDANGVVDSRDALIILSYAVGIDIPGQRVLLLAPGSCATGSAATIAVFPPAAALVPNQALPLLVQARDSAGRAVTLNGVTWTSSDPAIADVDASGLVTPVTPGTVTVTGGVGPGVHAAATITVVAGRPNWYVDANATGAPLQLGTATSPFENPVQAFPLVAEGDTVRVARGTYDFVPTFIIGRDLGQTAIPRGATTTYSGGGLAVGVVIIGGTPGDTTTRPVFRDPYNTLTALSLAGGQRTVVRNVVFQNFYYAVDLAGVRNVALEDVKIVQPYGGYGIYSCGAPMDTVRLDRVTLLGDSLNMSGEAIYYSGCYPTALTIVRDTKIRFWGDAVSLYDADSTEIVRTSIRDNGGYGLYFSQETSNVGPAVHVAHSRVERNSYDAVYLDYARRLVIDSSVIRARDYGNAISVYGNSGGSLAQMYLRGDSVYHEAGSYEWLDTYAVDSLVVDATVVRFPADTNLYSYTYIAADNVLMTNTQFLNVGGNNDGIGSEPLYVYGSKALFDNVSMTACTLSQCDRAHGIEAFGSGSSLFAAVSNSHFQAIRYPIYLGASSGTHMVTKVSVDSAEVGIDLNSDSTVAADNVLTRIYGTGIEIGGYPGARGLSTITRDSITCTPAASEASTNGMYLSGLPFTVDANAIGHFAETTGSCDVGIFLSGAGDGTVLSRNRLRHGQQGVRVQQFTAVPIVLDANGISGTGVAAIEVLGGTVTLTGNSIKNNATYGLYVPSPTGYTHQAHGNAFQGNGQYAIYTFGALAPGDPVDASGNWWGADGILPGLPGADLVLGPVTLPPALGSDPTLGVVQVAPPVSMGTSPMLAGPVATLSAPAPTPTAIAPLPVRASAPPARNIFPARSNLAPAVAARAQLAAQRRAAQTATLATRAAQRIARQDAQRRAVTPRAP